MATTQLRQAFRFFAERCGVVGQAASSGLSLAKAEAWGRSEAAAGRLRVVWEDAPFPWDGRDDERDDEDEPDTVEACRVETRYPCCKKWETKTALCGIADADKEYRRLVEAELLSEVMPG